MDPPNLRKKHLAKDKSNGKGTVYSSKHIRMMEKLISTSSSYT